MLSCVVLITILLLVIGAMRLGSARLEMNRTATMDTFRDATTAQDPRYTGDGELPPLDGIDAARPAMPNRTHVARPETVVQVNPGGGSYIPPVNLAGKAGLIGPPWTFSAYPVGGKDADQTTDWFLNYAAESHTFLEQPLRLDPAWKP